MNDCSTTHRYARTTLASLLLFALILGGTAACTHNRPTTKETVSGAYISTFFTDPRYPDDANNRPTGIDADLVALIDAGQESVAVAAYDLDLDSVTGALIGAHADGLLVRVVTDGTNGDEDAIARLRQAGVPVVARPDTGRGIMHNKFVVVDGTWVWTGSWNLTSNGTYRNNNHAVVIASRAIAEDYTAEFEEMFAGQFGASSPAETAHPSVEITTSGGTTARVEVAFAPEDGVEARILDALASAQSTVRFLAFVFTSDPLANRLIELDASGVQVQGVVEARSADDPYSQVSRMRAGGIDVLTDGNPYIMHHKLIIIDDQIVVLGSYNFSANAETWNDENVLIVHDPRVAATFLAEFARVYQQAATQ
ncbi:MAG: phospholipase [Anaerolineae bacterium]|nr:phospholipase [Anaerolineae bacterium]